MNNDFSGGLFLASLSIEQLKGFIKDACNEALSSKNQSVNEVEYLTSDQVSTMFGKSKQTLWRWAKVGYLVPVKVGGTPMYKKSDVTKLMEE